MIQSPPNQSSGITEECSARLMDAEVEAERGANDIEVVFWADLPQADSARERAWQRIATSVHYMMEHLNQPLRVARLSARAGLSVSHFFTLFKNATGWTPMDFYIRTRMNLAAGLLRETNLQIKQLAALLGYDDQFYFSRLFKSVHGLSPREFRTRKNEASDPPRPASLSDSRISPAIPPLFVMMLRCASGPSGSEISTLVARRTHRLALTGEEQSVGRRVARHHGDQ